MKNLEKRKKIVDFNQPLKIFMIVINILLLYHITDRIFRKQKKTSCFCEKSDDFCECTIFEQMKTLKIIRLNYTCIILKFEQFFKMNSDFLQFPFLPIDQSKTMKKKFDSRNLS